MKPTFKGLEVKADSYIQLPPVGAYLAKVSAVRVPDVDGVKVFKPVIEVMLDICDGEYTGRFMEVYKNQVERFGKATYKGIFRLTPPMEGDEDWKVRSFTRNIWKMEESNPGYRFIKPDNTWDEQGMVGKTIGINLRERLYTYTDKDGFEKDGKTIEIGQFELVQDVKDGKCRPMRERDQRKNKNENTTDAATGYSEVNTDDLPWA